MGEIRIPWTSDARDISGEDNIRKGIDGDDIPEETEEQEIHLTEVEDKPEEPKQDEGA